MASNGRMLKHWPLFIGIAILVTAVVLVARHRQGPARASLTGIEPRPEPQVPPIDAQVPRQPARPAQGNLNVTLVTEAGYIGGYIVVLDERGAAERQSEVKDENGKAGARFDALTVGQKRVMFISFYGHLPASSDTAVFEAKDANCVISLRGGNSVRGVVVDALLRPLEGAHVVVQTEAFLATPQLAKPVPILETSRGFYRGIPGSTSQSHTSYALMSDGSTRRGAFSDKHGRFTIEAVSGSAASAVVTYRQSSVSVACSVDRETTIVLPISQADSSAAQRTFDEFSKTFSRLMQQLAANPSAERSYLEELRQVLYRMVDDSSLSVDEKAKLRKLADETCEEDAKVRERIRK